jgi:hypothetical protein
MGEIVVGVVLFQYLSDCFGIFFSYTCCMKYLSIIAALLILFCSCKNEEKRFEGVWYPKVESYTDSIKITYNGNKFIIDDYEAFKTFIGTGVLKDGDIVVSIDNDGTKTTHNIFYDNVSQELIVDNARYARIKPVYIDDNSRGKTIDDELADTTTVVAQPDTGTRTTIPK